MTNGFLYPTEEENSLRATFVDFDPWASGDSDKVENYRFLETGSYDFDEKRLVRTTLDALPSPVIKIPEKTGNPEIIGFRTIMS